MRPSVLIVLLLGLAACDATSSTIPVFGEPYRIERSPEPVLDGDTLRATVSFSGICGTHTFEPGYSVEGTEVWLRHRAEGADCTERQKRSIDVPIDTTRLAPSPVRLYLRPTETIELAETTPRGPTLP